jgi:hypothetical protein
MTIRQRIAPIAGQFTCEPSCPWHRHLQHHTGSITLQFIICYQTATTTASSGAQPTNDNLGWRVQHIVLWSLRNGGSHEQRANHVV